MSPGGTVRLQVKVKWVLSLQLCSLILAINIIPAQARERLRVATTTSVQDSGLMPYLLPHFEKKCGCKVDVIAVGSGQALKLAANGDIDMVLAHEPLAEEKFVNDGFGINRRIIMSNDFVILGPHSDPARIFGIKEAARAFSSIYKMRSTFISRGDASGTHQKELSIWRKAGIEPKGRWYLETGQGMGAVLTMANEKSAYTICDRSSYLPRMKQLINLRILVEGDPDLVNFYSVIEVNPQRFPWVKSNLARRLIDWLCSREGQNLIGSYRVGGHLLFKPVFGGGD